MAPYDWHIFELGVQDPDGPFPHHPLVADKPEDPPVPADDGS